MPDHKNHSAGIIEQYPKQALMPAFFIGHGNPLTTLSKNAYTEGWASIGRVVPRPIAILAISAHWYIPLTAVTANPLPRTIHDFGGFPKELHEVQYPAPGSPELARQIKDLLAPVTVSLDESWGLDHGSWTVLRHIFPDADFPVVQLSIDRTKPPFFHYDLGKRLLQLREAGVLVIGSGNLVHNLHAYSWENRTTQTFDWAVRFEREMRAYLLKGEDGRVVDYEKLGKDAALSVPTPDHFLPLLYLLGLRTVSDPVSFPVTGFEGGSMSMLCIRFG